VLKVRTIFNCVLKPNKKRHVALEWANLWKVYWNVWVKSNVLRCRSVCLEIRNFLYTYLAAIVSTNVGRGEATVPWPPPSDPKNKKMQKQYCLKLASRMHKKCVFLGVILQNFPGAPPRSPLEWSCLRHFPKVDLSRHAIVTKLGLSLGNFLRAPLIVSHPLHFPRKTKPFPPSW